MADTLLIHFSPHSDTHTWSMVNDAGELTGRIGEGPLEEAGEPAQKMRTVVLLDSTLVNIASIELPAMNQQKLMRAIPFALEEQLADDVEDLHFVFSRDDRSGPVSVVAIDRQLMQQILEVFHAAGIKPAAVIPDCLCLAGDDSQWCALFHRQSVCLQSGGSPGNSYDADLFETVLRAQLANCERKPDKLLLFSPENETAPGLQAESLEQVELIKVGYNTHPLVVYCGNYRRALGLNLLQHEFKPSREGTIAWRRWSAAAVLAIMWLASNMGVSAWQLREVKAGNEQIQAEAVRIYRETFPESKRIVNPRVQMEQKLKELKSGGSAGGSSMVSLLASSAPALSTDKTVELRSISFRNGRLDITVDSRNLDSIQSLNTRLNEIQGIRSEIISSSSEKDAVTGSLRIQQKAT